MGLCKEGIQQAKEASEVFKQLSNTAGQTQRLLKLTLLFTSDKQLDTAEEAALHVVNLFSEKNQQFDISQCHRALGNIYGSKGETEKAIHHFEAALEIASSPNRLDELFWTRYSLAWLFSSQGKLDDAHVHIEQAKLHAVDHHDTFFLARAMALQAGF